MNDAFEVKEYFWSAKERNQKISANFCCFWLILQRYARKVPF